MIRKFHAYRWTDVPLLQYKEAEDTTFQSVTRQVLFEGTEDIPCQWRYFEVAPGGRSSLERHAHTHHVMIFRGAGTCLLGDEVAAVERGDLVTVGADVWHQFRANRGEPLGFLCLVNVRRDRPHPPSREEYERLCRIPAVRAFLEGEDDDGSTR